MFGISQVQDLGILCCCRHTTNKRGFSQDVTLNYTSLSCVVEQFTGVSFCINFKLSHNWDICSKILPPWRPITITWIGPRREKTYLRGFRLSRLQTSLLSYRDKLENWNFAWSKFRYDTFQKANNKGADQTALCAGWSASLLFAILRRQVFSPRGLITIRAPVPVRNALYSQLYGPAHIIMVLIAHAIILLKCMCIYGLDFVLIPSSNPTLSVCEHWRFCRKCLNA